eukprot:c17859_g1_i1 orf=646-2202(-)
MLHWKIALAAGLPAAALLIVILIIVYNLFCCHEATKHEHLGRNHITEGRLHHSLGNPYQGRLHQNLGNPYQSQDKAKGQSRLFTSFHISRKDPFDSALRHSSKVASVWRMTYPVKPFEWSEHPGLIAEAVEHGWGAFAFTYTCSTCPVPVNFWEMCTSCSHKHEYEPNIIWEMGGGSEYMQKLWLNPGMLPKKENFIALVQALQASLPLPGPPLGSNSFPQEAYFEVTILAEGCEYNAEASQSSLAEYEHGKLISKHLLAGEHLSSDMTTSFSIGMLDDNGEQQLTKETSRSSKLGEALHSLSSHVEFSKFSTKENPLGDNLQVLAVGLAAGGAPPFRLPGCDVGSVGFHSNGRVYLNGDLHGDQEPKVPAMKLSWGVVKTTVGCGFDPRLKKVFFTVDGERVYELMTSSNEFGNPLYPTVAANYDVTLLVNFGQSPFDYALANAYRVSDPCFRRPFSRSLKNGSMNEDSGDLFSMGRIDSQWFMGIQSPGSEDVQHRHVFSEAESDLFEIVLDSRVP